MFFVAALFAACGTTHASGDFPASDAGFSTDAPGVSDSHDSGSAPDSAGIAMDSGDTADSGSTIRSAMDSSTSPGMDSSSAPRSDSGGGDASKTSCIGSSALAALGKSHLMIGVSGSNTVAAAAPFDLRYVYLSGGLFDSSAPCTSCGSCMAAGQSCGSGCAWWGCYNTPPGAYASDFETTCAGASPPQVPMFTYYEILQTADSTFTGFQEGPAEVTQAATSVALMTRYYADWRFLLQQIGQKKAMLHIEPDFWGYARQAGSATSLAAAVASANATDCGSMANTIAGMGQCMIAMVRKYSPNALVGLSASAWNIADNSSSTADVTVDASSVAAYLASCGQSSADFVAVETSDRDAGYYQVVQSRDTWWDPANATLPSFQQDLKWIKALTEALGTPALYWQTPLGNSTQNNTANHYKDNRVDYFFGGNASQTESGPALGVPQHWSDLAAAHVIGVAFGAGAGDQTLPDNDGGNLVAKTKAYITGGGQPLCP